MSELKKEFLFAKKFSFIPGKICLYNEVSIRKRGTNKYYNHSHLKAINNKENGVISEKRTIVKKYHNFQISKNAYRTLKKKINWLYYLSKSRFIITHNSKKIYNFKMLFLTLTLPSKQIHTTGYITTNYLNQFITEMRKITKMKNFVWRLEHQGNGNVHYHIVTDTYIDYYTARRVWNRILNKDGYVDRYASKFLKMNLKQYYNYVIQNQIKYKNDFQKNDYFSFNNIAKRYALQKKERFTQPNSVDVKSVTSSKKISAYIAKYFGKRYEEVNNCNSLDNETNSKSVRLWFCSRSLSKLKSICEYIDEVNWSPDMLIRELKNVKRLFYKYCVIIYYEFSDLDNFTKRIFSKLLKRYANSMEYVPSG